MISIIQEIKPWFDEVICYSQGLSEVKTYKMLLDWYEAKKDIINRWGGKLIIETDKTVTFELSPEDKERRLTEFISCIEDTYDNYGLAAFIDEIGDDFFANHLSADYTNCRGTIKIPKGTKVVKAFKYFETNERALYDLQTQASMIIQEDKVRGKLCMSVHPLDFLSSSENTYHWRSCHALDGDYRAGNLSYMLDSSTIICYLKTDNKLHKLPAFPESVPWNSKKWRMLLFLEDNRDALFAGRQYPFTSPSALKCVMDMFIEYWHKGSRLHWSNWMDDYITEFPRQNMQNARSRDLYLCGGRNVMLNGYIYTMEDLVTDAKNSRHFNDLKYSSFYIPKYTYSYYPKTNKRLHFSIGKAVPCMCCGEEVDREASMICLDCGAELGDGVDDYYTYCGCCERRIPREHAYWHSGIDDYVCNDCRLESQTCDCCEDLYYRSQLEFCEEQEKYMCPRCSEEYRRSNMLPGRRSFNFEYSFDLPF